MHDKTGSFTFSIASYQCDFTGRAPLPLLGSLLLHAASGHAHAHGFGYDDISRDKVAWVLSRLALALTDYPVRNEALTIQTWVGEVGRFSTRRCFCLTGSEGRVLGYASSLWAALDTSTRRPVNIATWRPDLAEYACPQIPCPVGRPAGIPALVEAPVTTGFVVGYSDIDINGHLNSVKYIEHMLNVFELAQFRDREICRFDIMYLAEGTFGQRLDLAKAAVADDEYVIETRREDQTLCRCRIGWE
ncbi:MAG: thioesterase [Verrucomicrobiota bacterium JB024]|nr:thioesterase [Verrucomicrobiota bacterium JB024]